MGTYRAQTFEGYPSDWEHAGYRGQGGSSVVELFETLTGKTAVVVGSGGDAADIHGDAESFSDAVVFAANDIGMYLKRVDHFVSLHGAKLVHWVGVRLDDTSKPIYRKDFKTHTMRSYPPGLDYYWDGLSPLFPLSGYFAMQIAWLMGAEKIILVGCPGDSTKRFFDAKPRPGARYSEGGVRDQIEKEMRRLPDFARRVRSTSGWTKEFFGGP